jgi:uncharacterized Zn finger protein
VQLPGLGRYVQARGSGAVYGVGTRFDHQPELLFRLRAVDEMELIANAGAAATPLVKQTPASARLLDGDNLSEILRLARGQRALSPFPNKLTATGY